MSNKRFYLVTRDLDLYLGLFLSPFLLLFAISTIFLVHSWIPGAPPPATTWTANDSLMPANLDLLGGRDQVNAIRGVLDLD